ncbi:MAG: class I SAM-dependent methyltransferase [Pseudomonadota bacterium]
MPDGVCIICGGPLVDWFKAPGDWRKPDADISFNLRRCPKDGYGRIDPIPQQAVLDDHYMIEGYYTQERSNKAKSGPPSLPWRAMARFAKTVDTGVKNRKTLIADELKRRGGADVLEIGCGHGDNLVALSEHGFEAYGIEPDPDAMAADPDFPATVHRGTAEDPPSFYDGRTFDGVVMSHVLEHCVDPAKAMRTVRRFLKPGGIAYIEVPNADCVDFRSAKLAWPHLGVPRHVHFLNGDHLEALATEAGLEVLSRTHLGYMRQFTPGWHTFGDEMRAFYRGKTGAGTLKEWGIPYYMWLLAMTAFAPKRYKYDSVAVLLTVKE